MKYFKIILLITIIFLIYSYLFTISEDFEDDSSIIVSNLINDTGFGFFSQFFFLLNHYIYCKLNRKNFKIKSDTWLFKYKNGWSDYFNDIELKFNESDIIKNYKALDTLGKYTVQNYIDAIRDIYVYNEQTIKEISKIKSNFNLVNNNYDSIFIRRGDKLAYESNYYKEELYINLLLKKNPNCSKIYLQTDDYNSFLNLEKYINDNKLSIKLYTLCDKNTYGVIVGNHQKNNLNNAIKQDINSNGNYLSSIISELTNSKSVEDMNSDEIYKHTLDMLIGIDIVLNSNICISDYQSNVSRFIKLAHHNPNNVYNIMDPDVKLDVNKIIMPAYNL